MNALRLLVLAGLSLLGACGAEPRPDPDKPDSYARRWTVTPAQGAPEQRLALPAAALAVLKSRDLADLRLFDATGRALPLARLDLAGPRQVVPMPSWPVMGRTQPTEAGVALAIGPDKVARVVGIAGPDGAERQVALLVDTRGAGQPALAVRVSADLPLRQPVTLRASASADLRTWEPLGEKTLFRTDSTGNRLDEAQIALNGATLKGRYLQVTWDRDEGVTATGAQLVVGSGPLRAMQTVATSGARLEQPHELRFTLHQPQAAERVEFALRGGEGVLPVRLYARGAAEQPWQELGAATLRSGQAASLAIADASGPQFRLVADARTPGFAAVPRIALQFADVNLVTRFGGKPPYQLAAGLDRAPRTLLAAADIVPQGSLEQLPAARVAGGAAPVIDLAPEEEGKLLTGRQAALWLSLLAGVAILAFAVLRLWRQAPPPVA